MSLAKASIWTAASTLIKIGVGLLVIKLLAVSFGPDGVGLAGNFRQLVTVLGVLSGAGIFNGVTKYIAEYQQKPERLRAIVATSSLLILVFSTVLAALFLLYADLISQLLFESTDFYPVIQIVGLVQIGIAYANFFLAILKGYRDARANALSIIVGSVVGALTYAVCYYWFAYQGALVGLALVPAMVVIPASILLWRRGYLPLSYFIPRWDRLLASQLSHFTIMALFTCVTMPLAYVLMRNLLASHYSWSVVGIWQGVTTISDAYLQFITASFSVYLLPTLSRLTTKQELSQEIGRALRFVLPAVAVVSLSIWLLRDFVVWLLFSDQFTAMRDLFIWQLIGDVLKVGAYVFGYLVIAKAALRWYIVAELSQFTLLISFSYWLIPSYGAQGAAQAYMATYIIYFSLCCLAFFIYRRQP